MTMLLKLCIVSDRVDDKEHMVRAIYGYDLAKFTRDYQKMNQPSFILLWWFITEIEKKSAV